jgi:hypothetical protein
MSQPLPGEGDDLRVADVNAVLTFKDEGGREWLCAGILGELVRYEGGQIVETLQHSQILDRLFALAELKLVHKQ